MILTNLNNESVVTSNATANRNHAVSSIKAITPITFENISMARKNRNANKHSVFGYEL